MKNVSVIVSDGQARIVTLDSTVREKGVTVHIVGRYSAIGDTESDEFGKTVGLADVMLPNGPYTETEAADRTRAEQSLFGNR